MVMVVATPEVDGTAVVVMAMPLVAVAVRVTVAMVVMVVVPMVVMVVPTAVLVPLCGRRAREQHEGGGNQTCDAELHGWTFLVRDVPRLLGWR